MQEEIFFKKNPGNIVMVFQNILLYSTSLGKLQRNKTYYINISVHWMQEGLFFSKKS
jgi:hypothetical protein